MRGSPSTRHDAAPPGARGCWWVLSQACWQPDSDMAGMACYDTCFPNASAEMSSCPEGSTCVASGISPFDGVCLVVGGNDIGDECSTLDASTDCVVDAVCVEGVDGASCLARCDFWKEEPCKDSATLCHPLGYCTNHETTEFIDLPF